MCRLRYRCRLGCSCRLGLDVDVGWVVRVVWEVLGELFRTKELFNVQAESLNASLLVRPLKVQWLVL